MILSAFPRNFGDSFNASYHANCCPETQLCFFAQSLASDPRPLKATSVLKTKFFILISADEKGATSALGFWPIPRPLSSSFTLSDDSFGLLYSLYPLLYQSGHRVQYLLTFILTWICYFGSEEFTYIPYSSFNGQSLAAC